MQINRIIGFELVTVEACFLNYDNKLVSSDIVQIPNRKRLVVYMSMNNYNIIDIDTFLQKGLLNTMMWRIFILKCKDFICHKRTSNTITLVLHQHLFRSKCSDRY